VIAQRLFGDATVDRGSLLAAPLVVMLAGRLGSSGGVRVGLGTLSAVRVVTLLGLAEAVVVATSGRVEVVGG
jgi:hypothetical protein